MPRIAFLLLLSVLALPCMAAEDPSPKGIAFFEKNIRPILVDRCQECHSESEPESGLNLESRKGMLKGGELGPAIVPGKPKESLLIKAVNHAEYLRMPPKDKLATKELANLAKWVKMGAPWPSEGDEENETTDIETDDDGTASFTEEQRSFWAFQPPVRPEPPAVKNESWLQSPIDNFILSRLESKDLKPAAAADKRTLLRRAAYDLTGLPPSHEAIEAFLADDSKTAFATVIDKLLASPRYGEHWGRHWLDVARYADTNGLDENMAYAHAFRYRDYVIDAFNNDKPYDRFVQEQIAGDLLSDAQNANDNSRFIATGFLAIGAKMLAEDDPMKMQMDIIDEQLNTVCQAFMGLTIGCCRCHDHKFDPLPAADYYSLAGIFKSTKTMDNHKVVAQWYNRKLSVPKIEEQNKKIDEELAATKVQLDTLDTAARTIKRDHVRARFGDYLLATSELSTFDASMAARPDDPKQPFAIADGYLRVEAEDFHRGDIQKTDEGYGKGIGVVLSSGAAHLEYDVQVARAGVYDLELRYAAADSRPFKILVNGKPVAKRAGGEVTGDWNPVGQKWFHETQLRLDEGKITIRFESNKVFPHIDKLALTYLVEKDAPWPFKNPRPLSLREIVERRELKLEIVREWQSFLTKIEKGEFEHKAFIPWVRLRNEPDESFPEKLADLATADETPKAIRMWLAKSDPLSVNELADAYQSLPQHVDEKTLNPNPKQPSPLDSNEHLALFRSDEQERKHDELVDAQKKLEDSRPTAHYAMGATEAKAEDLRVHLRGSHITLGKTVPRRFPQILSPPDSPAPTLNGSGRLELAQWMTEDSHPLTSRVMANRIWHWHFGHGIVASVDNFGNLGDRPTHPKLLDWLATEFVNNDWSVKQLHRTIMLSSAYQMSTRTDPVAVEIDPENKLFWRMDRRRLAAEEVRDSIVEIGEGLDDTMGGTLLDNKDHSYVNSTGSKMNNTAFENRRRSVYLPVIRSSVYKVFQTMDFPDPAVINGRRQTSTVAPQALMMMNSELVDRHAKATATDIVDAHSDPQHRIAALYERVLRRPASAAEIDGAEQFIAQALEITNSNESEATETEVTETTAWQSLCRILMSTNEFVYIE